MYWATYKWVNNQVLAKKCSGKVFFSFSECANTEQLERQIL